MAKSGRASGVRGGRREGDTPARLVQAAIESLKEDGFAGASARAIAARADCNQALIFYHFGTVTDLLLAALDETSRQRLEHYKPAIDAASSVEELVSQAATIYREDLEAGHLAVLAEMIAGSSSTPELGAEVAQRVAPWIDLVESTLGRVMAKTPFGQLIPTRQAAYAVVALYLGVEMLTRLDGDRSMAESLLAEAGRGSALFDALTSPRR